MTRNPGEPTIQCPRCSYVAARRLFKETAIRSSVEAMLEQQAEMRRKARREKKKRDLS